MNTFACSTNSTCLRPTAKLTVGLIHEKIIASVEAASLFSVELNRMTFAEAGGYNATIRSARRLLHLNDTVVSDARCGRSACVESKRRLREPIDRGANEVYTSLAYTGARSLAIASRSRCSCCCRCWLHARITTNVQRLGGQFMICLLNVDHAYPSITVSLAHEKGWLRSL